jgi:hypothetical protein
MNQFLKNRCLVVLTLATLLVVTAPVLANEARGTIAMIDPDNHTFTLVDNDNNILAMRILVGSQVLINDQESTVWDLLAGDQVNVVALNSVRVFAKTTVAW